MLFHDRNAWGKIQPLVCIDAAYQYTVGEELTSGSKNIRQISGIKSCHTSLKGLFFNTTLHISESSAYAFHWRLSVFQSAQVLCSLVWWMPDAFRCGERIPGQWGVWRRSGPHELSSHTPTGINKTKTGGRTYIKVTGFGRRRVQAGIIGN